MKHRNKRFLTISLALLVFVGLVIIFVLKQGSSEQVSKTKSAGERNASLVFKLKPTTDIAYKVTRTATAEDGTQTVSVFEKDAKGNARETSKINGELHAEVQSGEVGYSCSPSACSRLINDTYSPFLSAYDYDSATISNIAKVAKYEGLRPCPSGMCTVWSWKNDSGLQTTSDTLYINQKTEIISQVQKVVPSGSTYLSVYEFIPIIITIPPSPTELPSL